MKKPSRFWTWLCREFAILKEIKIISDDTLKIDGKYSRTSLTMATAWWACLYTYVADFMRNGFRMDAFLVMVGVALGSKVSDAVAKRINK